MNFEEVKYEIMLIFFIINIIKNFKMKIKMFGIIYFFSHDKNLCLQEREVILFQHCNSQ